MPHYIRKKARFSREGGAAPMQKRFVSQLKRDFDDLVGRGLVIHDAPNVRSTFGNAVGAHPCAPRRGYCGSTASATPSASVRSTTSLPLPPAVLPTISKTISLVGPSSAPLHAAAPLRFYRLTNRSLGRPFATQPRPPLAPKSSARRAAPPGFSATPPFGVGERRLGEGRVGWGGEGGALLGQGRASEGGSVGRLLEAPRIGAGVEVY